MHRHTALAPRTALAFAALLWLDAASARAETIETSYQYNVKAVCSLLGTFGDGAMAQGIYRTLINVGNPTDAPVALAAVPFVAGSLGDLPGGIDGVIAKKGELAPGGALSIDCFTLSSFFCPTAEGLCFDFSALDGFVRINSPVELDVTAIYTARPSTGDVASMDVETVASRRISRSVEVVSGTNIPGPQPRMKLRGPMEAQ
jgi:hypothetical protein